MAKATACMHVHGKIKLYYAHACMHAAQLVIISYNSALAIAIHIAWGTIKRIIEQNAGI